MKTFKLNLVTVVLYTALVMILASFASCGPMYSADTQRTETVRARVLENNSITHIILNTVQCHILKTNDSVWVDLATHRINDTAQNTMLCVIERKPN